eukprot:jgi/Bigna1/77362/fgenesh1_pg.47_\
MSKWSGDSRWYRAVIKQVVKPSELYRVHYEGFGDEDDEERKDVYLMDIREFKNVPAVGEELLGNVTSLHHFGAFVDFGSAFSNALDLIASFLTNNLNGERDGLVHVSQMLEGLPTRGCLCDWLDMREMVVFESMQRKQQRNPVTYRIGYCTFIPGRSLTDEQKETLKMEAIVLVKLDRVDNARQRTTLSMNDTRCGVIGTFTPSGIVAVQPLQQDQKNKDENEEAAEAA